MRRPSTLPASRTPLKKTRRQLALRRLGALTALLGSLSLFGAWSEARKEAADAAVFSAPGRLVDVGGFRLHLDCQGHGSPTVVIDAGLGDWSVLWRPVQQVVAGETRVCTYDRAGMGYSDPGPLPRDAVHFSDELHRLLQRAGLRGPYVLAGHSLGGLTMRVFAHRYSEEVAGLVLIESMSPQQTGTASSQSPGINLFSAAARVGLVRLLAGPLGLSEGLPPEDAPAYTARLVTPGYFRTTAAEAAGIPASQAQAGAVTTLGALPLTVVSRGQGTDPVWTRHQLELLQLSRHSTHVVARHSGHSIQLDEPQVAAAALLDMITRVR